MIDLRSWKMVAVTGGMALVAGLGFAGCKTAGGGASVAQPGLYLVSAQQTSFFRYGPAQASGPDQVLVKGEKLTLVKREFGYSRVHLGDGRSGYVATEDIAPAPPPAAPSSSPSLARKPAGERRRGQSPKVSSESAPPLPLPEPPGPSFRF
jgi:hypothetical protein